MPDIIYPVIKRSFADFYEAIPRELANSLTDDQYDLIQAAMNAGYNAGQASELRRQMDKKC